MKQIILNREAAALLAPQARVLDQRPDGTDVALVVEEAESIMKALEQEGVEHRVVDLNLDEIFEVYVAGKREPAREQTSRVSTSPNRIATRSTRGHEEEFLCLLVFFVAIKDLT